MSEAQDHQFLFEGQQDQLVSKELWLSSSSLVCQITSQYFQACSLTQLMSFQVEECSVATNSSLLTEEARSSWCYYGALNSVYCPHRYAVRNGGFNDESMSLLLSNLTQTLTACEMASVKSEPGETTAPTLEPSFPPTESPSRCSSPFLISFLSFLFSDRSSTV
jgi:hypothetical protein